MTAILEENPKITNIKNVMIAAGANDFRVRRISKQINTDLQH